MDNIQKPIEWQNEDNSTLDFDYKATETGRAIIKVVGVGGGGSNAVRHMFQEGIQDVSFLIINTDYQALKGSPIPNKLQISDKGLGAGAKPEVARQYALQYEDQIRAALQDGTEMVFITAGMGGGTGTGAAPIVARIAHELGILTVGIVTIPFEFEGRDKILMALDGVKAIKEHVDALLVVNNNRLIDIYPDFNFFNAFKKADDTLTVAAKSISDIINIEGYMNLDFADVSTTLRNGGVALISTGSAKGENRVTAAIKEAITSPLLQDNDISNAKHLLFEICFSETHPVSMAEIAEVNSFVRSLNPDIKVIWGAMVDNSLGENVKLIILASGFEMDENGGIKPELDRSAAKNNVIEDEPTETTADDSTIGTEPEQGNAEELTEEEQAEQQMEIPEESVQGVAVTDSLSAQDEDDDTPAVATGPAVDTEQNRLSSIEDTTPIEESPMIQVVEEQPIAKVETISQAPSGQPIQQAPVVQPTQVSQPIQQAPTTQTSQPIQSAQPVRTEQPVIPQPKPASSVLEGIGEITKYYGAELANNMHIDIARKAYYVLDDEELSNEELINLIEKLPAYNRSVEELGELKAKFHKQRQ